jgi:hypothetical protein
MNNASQVHFIVISVLWSSILCKRKGQHHESLGTHLALGKLIEWRVFCVLYMLVCTKAARQVEVATCCVCEQCIRAFTKHRIEDHCLPSTRQRQLAMHVQCQQITRSCRSTACFKSFSRHPTRIQCQHVSNRQPSPPHSAVPEVTHKYFVPQKALETREQQHVQASRREVLSTSALLAAAALLIPQPAEAVSDTRSSFLSLHCQ